MCVAIACENGGVVLVWPSDYVFCFIIHTSLRWSLLQKTKNLWLYKTNVAAGTAMLFSLPNTFAA